MLISIIVPIYNIENYVEDCILSLINQTYKNIEIILVNDGSSDNSRSICQKYAKIDNRIKLINKKNEGLINARKTGILACSGELIAYVDGDDWVNPEMYEILYYNFQQSNADVIVANHIETWDNYKEKQRNSIPVGLYYNETLSLIHENMMNTGNFSNFGIFSYVWGKLFKRDAIIKYQLAVDDSIFIGEDAACLYPCLLNAKKIQIIDDANYFYRQRIGSMIKTPDTNELERVTVFYNFLKRIFLESSNSKTLILQLQNLTLSLLTVRSQVSPINYNGLNLYPFQNVGLNDSVVIFSAGTFGQILKNRIQKNFSIKLVLWVDDNYLEYSNLGLDVSSVEKINSTNFDKVLIAIIDERFSLCALNRLLSMNIPKEKICRVIHHEERQIEQTLLGYGIIS